MPFDRVKASGDALAARWLADSLQERGDLDGAEAAYERAAGLGDVDALGKLAILIDLHREDPAAAEAAYRRADRAGSVDGAGNLGRILKERGDLADAEAAFRRCVERGSVRALADYAGLLSMRADADGEEIAEVVQRLCSVEDRFNRETASGGDGAIEAMAPTMVFEAMWSRCDPAAMEGGARAADADGSAAGAYHLAILLRNRGDLRESVEAAIRSGERGYALGWVQAGVALYELGDLDGAEASARRAEQGGEARGASLLGSILDRRGDPDGALEAYRRGDEGGDGLASFDLGIELGDRGQFEEAEAALARAEERGVEKAAAARAVVRQALRDGEEPTAPPAILRCAEVLEAQGDPAAEAMFRRAVESVDPAVRAGGWRGVAAFLLGRGESDAALEALSAVVATGDPHEAPRALRNIGTLREERGEVEAAHAAYRASIEYDHPRNSQGARVNLAQLLEKQGDHDQAAQLFRHVIDSDHPTEGPRARVLLGMLLEEQGDEAGALRWFESAIDGEDEEWAQRAAFNAGGIYMARSHLDRAVDAFRLAEQIDERSQSRIATFMRAEAERMAGHGQAAFDSYLRLVRAGDGVADELRCGAAKEAGRILVEREDYGRARELLIIAAEAEDPSERARGLLLLGGCEWGLGDRASAVTAFESARGTAGAPEEVRETAIRGIIELRG